MRYRLRRAYIPSALYLGLATLCLAAGWLWLSGMGQENGDALFLQLLAHTGRMMEAYCMEVIAHRSSAPMQISAVGVFPSLDLLPRLSLWIVNAYNSSLAAAFEWACAATAMAGASWLWCRRLVSSHIRLSVLVGLCALFLACTLTFLAILPAPALAISLLAGSLTLTAFAQHERNRSLAALLGTALALVAAWTFDSFFWTVLPACFLILVVRTPASIKSISPVSIAVVTSFPVMTAMISAAFITLVFLRPSGALELTAEFEAISRAQTSNSLAILTFASLMTAAVGIQSVLLAIKSREALMSWLPVLSLPLSAVVIGVSCSGMGGASVALPFLIVAALEGAVGIFEKSAADRPDVSGKPMEPIHGIMSVLNSERASGQAILVPLPQRGGEG